MKKILVILLSCFLSMQVFSQNYQKIRQAAYNEFKQTLVAPSQFILTDINGNKIPLNKIKVSYLNEKIEYDSAYWYSFIYEGETYKYTLYDNMLSAAYRANNELALSLYQSIKSRECAERITEEAREKIGIRNPYKRYQKNNKPSVEPQKDSVIIYKKTYKPIYLVTIIGDARNRMGGYEQMIAYIYVTPNGTAFKSRIYNSTRVGKINLVGKPNE